VAIAGPSPCFRFRIQRYSDGKLMPFRDCVNWGAH
jgi:hypothetical protein